MNTDIFSLDDETRALAFEHYRKGLALLSEGHFADGWKLFEERLKIFPLIFQEILSPTPNTAADFKDRHIIIIGDPDYTPSFGGKLSPNHRVIMGGYEIMFAQYYAALLNSRPRSIQVLADRRFCTLLRRSFPEIKVLERPASFEGISNLIRSIEPNDKIVLPLASLGKVFITTHANVPLTSDPWIHADASQVEKLQNYIRDKSQGRIPVALSPIGIGISGKSIDPAIFFAPFKEMTDRCLFINFQYISPHDKSGSYNILQAFTESFRDRAIIAPPVDLWDDMDGAVAMLTAIKHENGVAIMAPNLTEQLACSVGIPQFKPLHGSHTPHYGYGRAWNEDLFIYPWTRTYLQEKAGDWQPVLKQIADDLVRYASGERDVMRRHDPSRFKPTEICQL